MKFSWRPLKFSRILLSLCLIALSVGVIWQHNLIYDSWQAYRFQPEDSVAAMADETGMNDRGQLLFFASHPTLMRGEDFNQACESTERNTMVIGCYDGRDIYLYDVDNQELAGVEQVTAAHEMLHAAYDRLSTRQRRQVDVMLQQQADGLKQSAEFSERMDAYATTPAEDRLNELHSILGTEVRQLSDELEAYYRRYFTDRSKVVELFEQYSGVFRELQLESDALVDFLDNLARQINERGDRYRSNSRQLAVEIRQFNRRARDGDFSSQSAFAAERAALVERSNQLESEYRSIQRMIERYNQQKAHYDEVALHLTQLNNSLDSSIEPAPQVR